MNDWGQKQVVCAENEELVLFLKKKRQEMAETEEISIRIDSTLRKAYSNVCNTKTRIKTLKEFSQIKGVGKWILKISQEFFEMDSGTSETQESLQQGKKTKGNRRYLPQKNSVAYALLITLYRGTLEGVISMRKQQLIDAAEASGLSRVPIMPEKRRGIPTQIGSSGREWYSGWSCMKTLLTKGLVIKSSCPAKYALTQEGVKVALECLSRCDLVDCNDLGTSKKDSSKSFLNESVRKSEEEVIVLSNDSNTQEKSIVVVPVEVVEKLNGMHANMNAIRMPPLKFGERFKDVYNVILILDDREQFAKTNKWARSKKIIENIGSEFQIRVEVRHLPIGDAIWIARDKHLKYEFVLDCIVERKEVDDFCMSIRDSRLTAIISWSLTAQNMLKCVDLILLLKEGFAEGTKPNSNPTQRSTYTALVLLEGFWGFERLIRLISCFTTEIHEGFDVQRTTGLLDTLRKYGYLTQAITRYYREKVCNDTVKCSGTCPSFDGFIRKCEDLEKVTVGDIFGIQLMQGLIFSFPSVTTFGCSNHPSVSGVGARGLECETSKQRVPQVTEEIALAVIDLYPTVISLARAYYFLVSAPRILHLDAFAESSEGNVQAQEEMLKRQSNNLISESASRGIFQLIWGDCK
ncbi:hypothetical protein C5167_045787 [Papaver somniferum]|uniref:Crossover junction endonuclease MUS81 n=1 Tax=Papaver somniferum TaxID=3469 RepID=A0A4Y7LE76_PAPSO|nr:hypothetical protein C5167_045787 [Papaver somniferum]